MLQKYVSKPTHILEDIPVLLQPNVIYEELLIRILDHKEY